MLLRSYLDGRVLESLIPLSNRTERQALLAKAGQDQGVLWGYALQAAESDKSEVTSGLFIEALNRLIDSFGRRNAELDRHVPEVVMLLFWRVPDDLGCCWIHCGHGWPSPVFVAYVTLGLILVVIFIIIDLDRPPA